MSTDVPAYPVYRFRHWYIPARMMCGLQRYFDQGVPPGDFLMAVLENNLMEATGRADDENLANLPAYAAYLYNDAPAAAHGSPEKVRAWLAKPWPAREEPAP